MEYNDKIRTGVMGMFQIPVHYNPSSLPDWLNKFIQNKSVNFTIRPNLSDSTKVNVVSVRFKNSTDVGWPGDFIVLEQNKVKLLRKENI